MSDENELLEPLATEAGQEAIVRAIRDISSLEYAVRAEQAASTASVKAGEASQSASEASEAEDKAKYWATKTDGYVEQETITIPPEQEGEEPTTETINLYSARYYAALAQDIYNNMSFDSVPTENSTNMVNSGVVYDALQLKADKSTTYTKAEVDTAISNVQSSLIFDTLPTQNSNNLVKSGGIYSALDLKADKSTTYTKTETDTQISTAVSNLVNSAPSTLDTLEELANALGDDPNFATTIATQLGNKADKSDTYTKTEVDTALNAKADQSTTYTKTEVDTALSNVQSTLTFDNVPTANSDNPVKSSGIKTALDGKQDTLTFDSTPTANSNNPVTSGGIYTALQNVDIDIDDEITEDSDNPVTSAAIYEALQNFTPSGGGGASGLASGVEREELWSDTSGWNSGTITLNKSWKDYDVIDFVGARPSESPTSSNPYVTENYLTVSQVKTQPIKYLLYNYDNRYMTVSFTSDTVLTAGNNSDFKVYNVYGIKFSKNLSEQMYSNVLYENSSGWSSGSITLNDSLENYDFIEFIHGESSYPLQRYNCIFGKNELLNMRDNVNKIILGEVGNRYFGLIIDSNTQLSYWQRDNSVVYKIIGYKMAKGGYSGIVSDARMTVKSGTETWNTNIPKGTGSSSLANIDVTFNSPMPDTNYIVSAIRSNGGAYSAYLKTTIGNKTVNGFTLFLRNANPIDNNAIVAPISVDWIAIRPNSYTREGMVEDVLFSNASGVNSGTINLSGNISDYDLIEIYRFANDNKELYSSIVSSSDLLQRNSDLLRYVAVGDGNNYIEIYCPTDSSVVIRSISGEKITKITGIKFGRYVSGVAIDNTVTQNSNAVVTSGAVYDALQNYTPSGGGSSITVDSTITQGGTNPVEGGAIYTALGNKADAATTLSGYGITDAYTKTEVDTALAAKGDVTTSTDQNITGTKTFVGQKKVKFKQSGSSDKLGFTLYASDNTEKGYLEYNPTNTVEGAPMLTLGNYASAAGGLCNVGFRRYSSISGASGAYNLLTPLIADARTPFSLTTSYTNFYLPLGFTDGTTTVKTAKSGLVDLSPLLQAAINSITNANGVAF